MNNNYLNKIINHSEIGYALCELVYNQDNIAVDFVFIDSNDIFQEIFGVVIANGHQTSGRTILKRSKNLILSKTSLDDMYLYIQSKRNGKFDLYFKNTDVAYEIDLIIEKDNKFILLLQKERIIDNILFKKHSNYETIVNSMNDLIFIMNLDFSFVYVSPSVKNILGYTENELVGNNLKDLVRPDSYRNIREAYDRALESNNESSWLIEIYQHHKNGKEICMEYMVRFLKDDDGRLTGIMGLGRDITKWMKAKKELRENQESMSLLLNSTAEGIFGLDKKGYITFVNKSCLNLLGYTNKKDLINKHIQVIMGIDNDEEVFLERFQKVFERGIGHYYEVDQFLRADGSNFIAEFYIYPQTADGVIIGSVVTFFDITERIKTENQLFEAERSKSVLIANLPGMAYRCALDDKYTIHFVSDGCYDLTGYYPESFINNRDLSFNDIIVPKYRQKLRDRWNSLIGKNEKFKEEYEVICADGSYKWVLEHGQIIYGSSRQVEGLEGIIIDITDQKQKQAEIEYLSLYDSLTGVRNRTSFEKEKIRLLQEQYLPISLIVGDINGLKLINDALGHSEGDKILIKTATLLNEVIKDKYFVARTSGDEFSILLPNTDSIKAYSIMKQIINHIDEHNAHVIYELSKVNIALGFATLESLEQNFSEISAIAEDYMYKRKLNDRLSSHSTIISSIRSTMYEKSQITEEHAERLKEFSNMIGHALNLSQVELDELALVSTLHDIGKVGIDDRILKKPGKLTEEEWLEMKKHPEIGYRICMASPELMSIAPYVLHHHERWDGTGYPTGVKGEDIPLLARIIAIVDAYDAMTEDRPYRESKTKEFALEEIRKNAGTQFDPELAMLFIKLMNKN